jgi:hypothetical protein
VALLPFGGPPKKKIMLKRFSPEMTGSIWTGVEPALALSASRKFRNRVVKSPAEEEGEDASAPSSTRSPSSSPS